MRPILPAALVGMSPRVSRGARPLGSSVLTRGSDDNDDAARTHSARYGYEKRYDRARARDSARPG